MNKMIRVAFLLAASVPAIASAQTVTFDFEGPTSFVSILDYYNGGADDAGAIGPDLGAVFGGALQALRNDDLGPYFSNAPTPVGVMFVAGDLVDPLTEAVVNVDVGFYGQVSFHYSSTAEVLGGVSVWSGLNGTGSLLASFDLGNNAQTGCSDTGYCHFDSISAGFSGVAKSITFGAATSAAAFDNLTITAVPEPTSALLMVAGVAGLLAARRRG